MSTYYHMYEGTIEDTFEYDKNNDDHACMTRARDWYTEGRNILVTDLSKCFPPSLHSINSAMIFTKEVMRPTIKEWEKNGVASLDMRSNMLTIDLNKAGYEAVNAYMSFNRMFTEFAYVAAGLISASLATGLLFDTGTVSARQIMCLAGEDNMAYKTRFISGHTPWNNETTVSALYAIAMKKPLPNLLSNEGYKDCTGANKCWNNFHGDRRLTLSDVRLGSLTDNQRRIVYNKLVLLTKKYWRF